MDFEEVEETEGQEDEYKEKYIHYWTNHKHFNILEKIEMRSSKTRIKTIVIEKRNKVKNLKTDMLVKGTYSSTIVT
jgi:hypothetical protein